MFIEPYLANVTIFGGTFAPRGWAFCQGQLMQISQNDALFALIGTTYGGDGQTTFALPDLRGRVAVHPGQGPGLSNYALGQIGGNESITITSNQMASHTHAVVSFTSAGPGASNVPGTTDMPTNNVPAPVNNSPASYNTAAGTESLGPSTVNGTTNIAGNSQPVEIIPPYLAMNYIICVEGIFPSRN